MIQLRPLMFDTQLTHFPSLLPPETFLIGTYACECHGAEERKRKASMPALIHSFVYSFISKTRVELLALL